MDLKLNALVSEHLMRFRWDESRCRVCGFSLDPEGKMCRVDNCSMRPRPPHHADDLPNFSGDMAAAWTVVEKMGVGFSLQYGPISEPFRWEAGFQVQIGLHAWRRIEADAPTAAEAICRALLKAKGIEADVLKSDHEAVNG